jgi:hypothetical protein
MKYGKAQDDFVKHIRASIDANPDHFFDDKDWRNLTIKGGRHVGLKNRNLEAASFYVKPVAAWVPHLLIPGHVPSCPNCEHARGVDTSKSRWIANPKILYGLRGHRYLDTKMYYCNGCLGGFTGYNLKSLHVDSNKVLGFFTINLSNQFAVDEELYNEIVNSGDEPSNSLQRRLEQNIKDQYFADFQYYLYAVQCERIRVVPRNTAPQDSQQTTLDKHLQPITKPTIHEHNLKNAKHKLDKKQWVYLEAKARAEDDLNFKRILQKKTGRNDRDQQLRGLGPQKLKKLISLGVESGRALLEFQDPLRVLANQYNRSPLSGWKKLVEEEFLQRTNDAEKAEGELVLALQDYDDLKNEMEIESDDNADIDSLVSDEETPNLLPPMFSSMTDPQGYNARFLSRSRIDSLLTTENQHRKPVQLGKMYGLKAQILKIDFNYKLAKKIHVWQGRQGAFRPYKCFVTIQNEDALTVFWKGLKGSESIKEITPDLRQLKERLESNNGTANSIRAIYIDNCCTVSKSLNKIFPEAQFKLDAFHWLKRWNDVMENNNSKQASIFRAFMSKALFVVSDTEYRRAKEAVLQKLKREPTVQEILNASKGSIPAPDLLEQRVSSVLLYCFEQDMKIDWNLAQRMEDATDQVPIPPRFFRRNRHFLKTVQSQLLHVRLGCLTDPITINVLRENRRSGIVRTARGTGTNEADNLYLDRLTGNHIGISRAERLIGSFFEKNNHRKQLCRLGEDDYGTFRTEQLALINSLAHDIGYVDLPFPNATHPAAENVFQSRKHWV